MKKSIIILFICATFLLSGCNKPKENNNINETLNKTEEEAISNQEQSVPANTDIQVPKISCLNFFGKNLSHDNIVTSVKITDASDVVDDNIYLSLLYQEKDLLTKEIKERTDVLRLPNSPQMDLDETTGKVISNAFTQCNKVVVNPNRVIMAGYNSILGGLRIEAYPLIGNSGSWQIVKGTQSSQKNGAVLFQGDAEDFIKCSDSTLVYISNIPNEAGINNCFITKIDDAGNEIWSKQLSYNNESLYLMKVVQGLGDDECLVLSKTKDSIYYVLQVQNGEIVKSIQLDFYANSIKSMDGDYFILGTNQKYMEDDSYDINNNSYAKVIKMNSSLDIIYTYTNEAVNLLSDFTKLDKDMYLFIGNKERDVYIASYYDTGKTLELVQTDRYKELGQPMSIIKHDTQDRTEYIITGINEGTIGTNEYTYSWIAHLYTLDSALNSYYKEITDNDGHAKFLRRGNSDRLAIAYSIAGYEGNEELMYIRYMKSDGFYAYVITGAWYNSQIVEQYLLQKKDDKWQVLEKYKAIDRCFEKIKTDYPDVDLSILPPYEVADYVIKVLDNQPLKAFINYIDINKSVSDISYCSYIGDYFCVSFNDGTSYLIKYPESPSREIYKLNEVNTYNFYLFDEEKPPYFILIQD